MIEPLLQAERALSVGLLDQAERLYRQASELDPRNSIAVAGLARVALERGDERTALEEGRRALAIDPENAAASRLVQRLEEVMRYRGEEPPAPAMAEPPPGSAATPEEPEPAGDGPQPAADGPQPARRRSLLGRILRRG